MRASMQLVALLRDYWFAILPVVGAIYLLAVRRKKSLHRIPGPVLRSISPLPRIISAYRGHSHEDDLELHRKYGPIVRLAPNSISISDPSMINKIYGIGTKFIKSPFYELSTAHDEEGLIPDPFILTDKDLHSRMKRNAANAYSMNGLVQMEPLIETVTKRFIGRLAQHADEKSPADLGKMIANYTMDAVFSLTFGRDFDYMSHGDILGILRIMKVASFYMAVFGQIAWIHRYLLANPFISGWVFGSSGGEGEDGMMAVAIREVQRAKEATSEGDTLTFVHRLVLNQKNNPKQITDREVMTHAFGNITAGSDTTATALRAILYHVLKDREVYDKLCSEIRGANLTSPVPFAQANALPYLAAVIKEGMRIHPSVGMMLARTVPREGTELCGYNIGGGVEVGINPWIIQRDEDVFPQPDRFWPDRWLPSVSSDYQLRDMNRSFMTFGHGSHTCSGRWISTMEITKLIPTMLLEFDMKLVDGGRSFGFKNWWFTLQEGLIVEFTKLG